MIRPIFILIATLLLPLTIFARLGESLDECIQRYGPLVEKRKAELPQSDPDAGVFSKSGVTIIIEFHEGKAWRLIFRKPGMLASEVEALLKSNAGTGPWSGSIKIDGNDYRTGDEGGRLAISHPEKNDRGVLQLEFLDRAFAKQRYTNYLERVTRPGAAADIQKKTNPLPGF